MSSTATGHAKWNTSAAAVRMELRWYEVATEDVLEGHQTCEVNEDVAAARM